LEAQSLPSQNSESRSAGNAWSNETSRILSLENAWNQAERRHDVRALSLLLADIFENPDSDGSFMSRDQWLAMIKNGGDQYEELGNSGMVVHVYGAVAVVTGMYTEKGKVKGKMVMRSGRFTDTWIKQSGDWKCVASQSTLISP
jgi:ketosteroid isomerase-like protein